METLESRKSQDQYTPNSNQNSQPRLLYPIKAKLFSIIKEKEKPFMLQIG